MRRILGWLGKNVDKALVFGILFLIAALLVISACYYIPGLDAPESLEPVARYLSFVLLPLAIVCFVRNCFPHPLPAAVFIALPGLIVAAVAIAGRVASLARDGLFLGACVAVTLLLWKLGTLWQRLVEAQGWTWARWIAKGLSLVWTLAYSLIGLALVGSAAYLVYFGFTEDSQGETPWFVFPLMGILPGVLGWQLVAAGARSARETLRDR